MIEGRMDSFSKGFEVTREYVEALMNYGKEKLVKWYAVEDDQGTAEERVGKSINFEDAEEILLKYRKDGIGPAAVREIMENGTIEV